MYYDLNWLITSFSPFYQQNILSSQSKFDQKNKANSITLPDLKDYCRDVAIKAA
jgi:hypothetical protein